MSGDDEPDSLPKFNDLLRKWEEDDVIEVNFDPTKIFHELSEILEKETNVYIASDPDPFEERHPSRVDQNCQLGIHLKALFKKENLVKDLFTKYLKDNYFVRAGVDKSSFDLNVATCRLVLDIMPGLEIVTIQETEGLTLQLYKWIETAEEPLTSYATGILSVVMELHEFASDNEIRERNARIVPVLITKLKALQMIGEVAREEQLRRPFALFSKSPQKRRISRDEDWLDKQAHNGHPENGLQQDEIVRDKKRSPTIPSGKRLNPGWPAGLKSPPHAAIQSAENSNSSWAEMELNIIGHFEVYPISLQTKQIYILRLLSPLAEYQDFVPMVYDNNLFNVIKKYINVKETRDARLGFEAYRLLGSLFCHKKFTLEWVYSGGLEVILETPRPSIASTGSSMCIYYLSCDSDTMEKICGLQPLTLERLVKYCLWLIECSHATGRQYAIMFFTLALPFKTILDKFDAQDGLRRLYNAVSTLQVCRDPDETDDINDDELVIQRQTIKNSMHTLKQYVETHLAVKCEEMSPAAALNGGDNNGPRPEPIRPPWIPYKLDRDTVTEQINSLLRLLNFRARWHPIDQFVKLGGVGLLLKIIVRCYDWVLVGKEDTVKYALDIIAVCSVLPRVQLSLCENLVPPDDKHSGIFILIACSEGEVVNDPNVQKAALSVLCHLLCAPISRVGGSKHQTDKTPAKRRSSEDVINSVWDCFRANNGIMAMLQLVQSKTPISDADGIRALACQALVGLARSPTGTQIMSKLPIFNNGVLTMLVREPVLPDNIVEHQKFQRHAQELLEKVSGPGAEKSYDNTDITLDMLHRAAVVANTKIRFNNKQLYQLIHEHLVLSGLKKTAELMRKEAEFVPLVSETSAPVYQNNGMISATTPLPARRQLLSPPPRPPITPRHGVVTPASRVSIQSRVQGMSSSTSTPQRNISESLSRLSNSSLPIRIHRTPRTLNQNPFPSKNHKTTEASVGLRPGSNGVGGPGSGGAVVLEPAAETDRKVTLTGLVSDYLSNKHSMCKNPMTTCPEFDLFLPHKCPDKRPRRVAPINFASRQAWRNIRPPHGGRGGAILDRKLIYSRFRPMKAFRATGDERDSNMFTCCAFSGDGQFILSGNSMGEMKMYNISSGEETTYQIHESSVSNIQPSRDNRLVLTSSSWRAPFSKLWTTGEFFDERYEFKDEEYVEFSKLTQDKVIGTRADGVATVYDVNTGKRVRLLKPKYSNEYHFNRACFDPTDHLILCDGVLWDHRREREIHKLDKLNQNLSGVFHPTGLEIISNTEVWDIRTFHLQRTVPQLDQCRIVFSTGGDIMYGLQLEQDFDDEPKFETSFRTFECSDYSSIATFELKKAVLGLCPSWNDLNIAVVEQGNQENLESVVRLYDVGRSRDIEEEAEEGGDEEEEEQQDEDFSDEFLDDDENDEFDLNDSIFGSNSEDGDADEMINDDDNDEEEDDEDDDEDENENGNENDEDDNDAGDAGDDNDSWEDIEEEEEYL